MGQTPPPPPALRKNLQVLNPPSEGLLRAEYPIKKAKKPDDSDSLAKSIATIFLLDFFFNE